MIISPLLSQIPPPLFSENSPAFYILSVYFPPTLTMMHLCITHCTYWTPLTSTFLQLPPLYKPSLQIGLTTAPRFMLSSLPVDGGVWIGSCALLPAKLAAYLNLAMSLN